MVPHKTARGQAAMERMKCFEGVPAPYDKVKRMVVPDALQPLRLQQGHKFCQLGTLSTYVSHPTFFLFSIFGGVKRTVMPDLLQPLRLQQGHRFWQLGTLSTFVSRPPSFLCFLAFMGHQACDHASMLQPLRLQQSHKFCQLGTLSFCAGRLHLLCYLVSGALW